MNHNETRTLWISVAAALMAVFLLYSYTNERNSEMAQKYGARRSVVVAKKDINEMSPIDESMIEVDEKPTTYIEPGALTQPEDAVNMVALAPIKAGEQILQNKIMQPSPITGLSFQITPQKRAVSLPVDEIHGVSKLLKPGDRIDLVAAVDVGRGPTQHKEVRTILQDVSVLATGQDIVNNLPMLEERVGKEDFIKNLRRDNNFSTITVEVSPQQAQNLIYILATSPGSLFVTLRHPSDNKEAVLTDATVDTVLDRVDPTTISQTVRTPASVPQFVPQPRPVAQPRRRPRRRKGGFVDLH